jgi:hypothetical protein
MMMFRVVMVAAAVGVGALVGCSAAPPGAVEDTDDVSLEWTAQQCSSLAIKSPVFGGTPSPYCTVGSCCVTGGRDFNEASLFEKSLKRAGCDRPVVWGVNAPSGSASGEWWLAATCPPSTALTNLVLNTTTYGGYCNKVPIWSRFDNSNSLTTPKITCYPPLPAGKKRVVWDPTCSSGCSLNFTR